MFLEDREGRGQLRITHARGFDTLRRRMLPARGRQW